MNIDEGCYIIIPALNNKGPVKGALALYNVLIKVGIKCKLVVLKYSKDKELYFKGELVDLRGIDGFANKAKVLNSDKDDFKYSLSFCFSADLFNIFHMKNKIKLSSVRANNFKNYFFDYGYSGYFLAIVHYLLFNAFDHVIVISESMKIDVSKFLINKNKIIKIGNFIDEKIIDNISLDCSLPNGINLIFVGNLNSRKRIDLILKSLPILKQEFDFSVNVHILGEGSLRDDLEQLALKLECSDDVIFHGVIDEPYSMVSKADIFVLPSESEGVSRAMLESIYLETPVFARDVDANSELLDGGRNGIMFDSDAEFNSKLIDMISMLREGKFSNISIPFEFTNMNAKKQYFNIFNRIENVKVK